MRLHRFLKNNFGLIKSEINSFYNNHNVLINGEKVKLSYNILDDDVVTVDGIIIENKELLYYLYNKERGETCNNDLQDKSSLFHNLEINSKIFCVGRLDKDSEGLVLLTNDGELSKEFLSSSSHIKKEYIVVLKYKITEVFLAKLMNNHVLRGKKIKDFMAIKIDDITLKIVLEEGKYHQIRRMIIISGNRVERLKRVKIGSYSIEELGDKKLLQVEKRTSL